MFLRAGWPARVPCNPAPTVGFLSVAIRKVSGGKDVPAGGACPAPTSKEPFAAIAEQRWSGDVGGDYRGSASGVHIIR